MEVIAKEPNWCKEINDIPECDITLFFSSRQRPDFVKEVLERAYTKSSKENTIETIVRFDNDDPLLIENLKVVSSYNQISIVGPRYDGYESLHIYYDECASIARGDVLWQLNDDAWIVSQNWDKILLDYLKQFPKQIFACDFDILGVNGEGIMYSWCFPIMSRKMYQLLGNKFCYGDVKYIDTILMFTAQYLKMNKRIPVTVIHQHVWDNIPDETSAAGCLSAYAWMTPNRDKLNVLLKKLGFEIGEIFEKAMK